MRIRLGLVAATLVLTIAAAAPAAGQRAPRLGADAAGLGENDVREEPSHLDDANGFPREHPGEFWSPTQDPLILDAFVENGLTGFGTDLDNILNRAQHGDNYGDHERTMYPGGNYFAAWWGWWSDTGGGGSLQDVSAADAAPSVGEKNGAIDEAYDCEQANWDEFTWRGPHPCPGEIQHPSYPDDQMFGFVQPGTHAINNNALVEEGPVDMVLDSKADRATEPDFLYGPQLGQGASPGLPSRWGPESNRVRYMYDASLFISTSVVTAVNPQELTTSDGITRYDPFEPAGDPVDHAVDVDIYTAVHPRVEEAYRTAVWDPATGPSPDRGDNEDLIHEAGPKGWLKDDGATLLAETEAGARENLSSFQESSERQRGLVNDLVQDPFFHEPNQPDDDYNDWATYDADTSYGGLDGRYYEPGPDQAYPGYRSGERFWMDAQITINSFPYWVLVSTGWDDGTQFTPEAPPPGSPVEGTADEDDQSQGPGVLYMHAHAGTWYEGSTEGDVDTWVGDAPPDPYGNGTVQDPNSYQANPSLLLPSGASAPEFRGTCGVDINATLYPTSDTDGDGVDDWGAAGVYVMGAWSGGNPYSNVFMDVVGPAADPVLDPLRDNPQVGGVASGLFPEDDERLTRYRTTGPIEVRSWGCPGTGHDVGFHLASYNIILPTGTLDFTFRAEAHGKLVDDQRQGQHGETKKDYLTGQSITDVDRYGRILPGGS